MNKVLHIGFGNFFKHFIKSIFEKNNYKYYFATKKEEVFETLKNNKIDIIVSEIEVEDGRSIDIIKEMNETEYLDIPVIVLTSYDSVELNKEMFDLGVVDYIQKDASKDNIIEFFKHIIDSDSIIREIRNMNIAVLDDSNLEQSLIRNILNMNGIKKIDFYSDPTELLSCEKDYDIYLVDLVLPNITGEQVIIDLRKREKPKAIIAISGIESYKVISNVLMYGADDYITKPFNAGVFLARLRSCARNFINIKYLEEMVISDGLTKLYNHKYIFETLDKEIEKANRYGQKLSVIMFDIDHFKNVNDTYGHQTGDVVLKEVAIRLKKSIRSIDIVGRYGGEEFMVILPETDLKSSEVVGERIRKSVENIKFDTKGLKITISGGIKEFNGEKILEIVESADKLLYKAKESGRNCIKT